MEKEYIYYKNNKLEFNYKNNTITLNDQKTKKVEEDSEYTFKVLKTKIKAINGTKGLYTFINNCINKNFGTAWIEQIVNNF